MDGRSLQDGLSNPSGGRADRQRMGERINEWTQTVVRWAFQPVREEGRPSTNGGTNQRIRPRTADGSSAGFSACQGGQTATNGERINESDRGPRTAVAQTFRPVGGNRQRMGERINESDRGPRTAVAQAFQPAREGRPQRMGNESTNGRQSVAGWAFQPVREEGRPSTNGETNQRMDGRPW